MVQGTRRHGWLADLDMYRKIPVDLMEGSQEGRAVSWIALLVMMTLFVRETISFFTTETVTDIFLDKSKISQVRVDFNITLMDLRCEFATVNVVSFLGTQQNITKDIERFHLEDGSEWDGPQIVTAKDRYKPKKQEVIMHDPTVTKTMEQMLQEKKAKDSVDLDSESLQYALEDLEFVFVKFYANWCSHCRALAPTWERFAEVMHDVDDKVKKHFGNHTQYSEDEYQEAKRLHLPVLIGEVDCVEHKELCLDEDIRGYPTMILYVNGERYKNGVYEGDRTVISFIQFLMMAEEEAEKDEPDAIKKHAEEAIQKHLNMTKAHEDWLRALNRTADFHEQIWDASEHPGCRLVGSLHMNRAPGHFFIEAKSLLHNINPYMANMSHVIHHLSFHPINGDTAEPNPDFLPSHYQRAVAPLDGHAFVVHELHEAWHHYFKLVSTNTDRYQVLPSSQVSLYRDDHVPEAKFVLDISPIALKWRKQHRPWYDYVTSLMAILGGTFTVVGMIEYGVTTASRQIRGTARRPRPRPPPPPQTNGKRRAAP